MVIIAIGLYGAVAFYFLPYANFTGDLTRVGMLPEHFFGWRAQQPAIDSALMKQASWKDADVLVIGDSFSDGRVWQTILTAHGLKVHSEEWNELRAVCSDFKPWLARQGFHGKIVIFEFVERNIPNIDQSLSCQHMFIHHSPSDDVPVSPPATTYDPDRRSYSGRLSVGIETAWKAYRYIRLSNTSGFQQMNLSNGAKLARVPDGCALFSHLSCNDALFLSKDKSADIPDSVIDKLKLLNARLPGITPIWVFVPNKSTAYLYPNKQFWNKAAAQVNAPNLLAAFRAAIQDKVVDLYYGNNTHLSTRGYLLMGQVIYHDLPQDSLPGAAFRSHSSVQSAYRSIAPQLQ